ncbi:MAG: hypothetical protein CMN30_08335 [Sandaracinus sp.]|nr:hypothetical protein [Sandaracinus sp.]
MTSTAPALPPRLDVPHVMIRALGDTEAKLMGRMFGAEWVAIPLAEVPPHQLDSLYSAAHRHDVDVRVFEHADGGDYLVDRLGDFDKKLAGQHRKRYQGAAAQADETLAAAAQAVAERDAAVGAEEEARRAVDVAETAFADGEGTWEAVEELNPSWSQARVRAHRAKTLADKALDAAQVAQGELLSVEADIAEALYPLAVKQSQDAIAEAVDQVVSAMDALRSGLEELRRRRDDASSLPDEATTAMRAAGRTAPSFSPTSAQALTEELADRARSFDLDLSRAFIARCLTSTPQH